MTKHQFHLEALFKLDFVPSAAHNALQFVELHKRYD